MHLFKLDGKKFESIKPRSWIVWQKLSFKRFTSAFELLEMLFPFFEGLSRSFHVGEKKAAMMAWRLINDPVQKPTQASSNEIPSKTYWGPGLRPQCNARSQRGGKTRARAVLLTLPNSEMNRPSWGTTSAAITVIPHAFLYLTTLFIYFFLCLPKQWKQFKVF